MAAKTNYNLIQVFDPKNKYIPIRDRFAKLSLSSKKKCNKPVNNNINMVDESQSGDENCFPEDKLTVFKTQVNPLFQTASTTSDDGFKDRSKDTSDMELQCKLNFDNEVNKFHFIKEHLSQQFEKLSINESKEKRAFTQNICSPEKIEELICISLISSEDASTDKSQSSSPSPSASRKLKVGKELTKNLFKNNKDEHIHDVSMEKNILSDNIIFSDQTVIQNQEESFNRGRMVARADTEIMTLKDYDQYTSLKNIEILEDIQLVPPQSVNINAELNSFSDTHIKNFSLINKGKGKILAQNETIEYSQTPESIKSNITENGKTHNSLCDFYNTPENSVALSLDSIVISETDEEENDTSNNDYKYIHTNDNRKKMTEDQVQSSSELKSQSLHNEVTESSNSEDSVKAVLPSINISAKIKIKIHIPSLSIEETAKKKKSSHYCEAVHIDETSTDEDNQSNDSKKSTQRNNNSEVYESDNNKTKFLSESERLLTQLYGNTWRTPDIIRNLKRTSSNKPLKKNILKEKPEINQINNVKVSPVIDMTKNTSFLNDFSIFRENIVTSNLDSTRFSNNHSIRDRQYSWKNNGKANQILGATKFANYQDDHIVDDIDIDVTELEDVNNFTRDNDFEIKTRRHKNKTEKFIKGSDSNRDVIYLDLSKEEVEIQSPIASSPPANNDEKFALHLQEVLRTYKAPTKPRILYTPDFSTSKTKRKLFKPNAFEPDVEIKNSSGTPEDNKDFRNREIKFHKTFQTKPIQHLNFELSDSKLSSRLHPPKLNKDISLKSNLSFVTSHYKYGFLKSLDVRVSKIFCHPEALFYRDNYRTKKSELVKRLYDIYNEQLFETKLEVPVVWNKKLCNTAGRCLNKKRMGVRSSVIELSEKVLTSADRLRCTLLHELCHAATWILNGEGGHGATWKNWAKKANEIFPELPKIGVCHQYDIEYKYTYKCTLCEAKSLAHSKSKKVENIRCSYCHGAIEIFLNKRDKEGNVITIPTREPTGFAKFVKDNYKKYKNNNAQLKHADVMKLLSNNFAIMKLSGNDDKN